MTSRSVLRSALALAFALVPSWASAGSVSLDLVPSALEVAPGGTVDVDVVVTGLGSFSSPGVRTFDLVLGFDPTVFVLDGTVIGPSLGDPGGLPPEATASIGPAPGEVNVLEVSFLATADLLALQGDTLTLFTASFSALGTGDGTFTLAPAVPLGDELADPILTDPTPPVVVSVGSTLDIPTLDPFGLALVILLLALAGTATLRRALR